MSEQWQEIPGEELAAQLIEQLSTLSLVDRPEWAADTPLGAEHDSDAQKLSAESTVIVPDNDSNAALKVVAMTEREAASAPQASAATANEAAAPEQVREGQPRVLVFDRSLAEQAEAERVQAALIKRVAHDPLRRQAVLEAILFAAAYPVAIDELARLCEWPRAVIKSDLAELATTLEGRGIRLQIIAGECRLVTAADCAFWVERYLQIQNRVKLSRPQVETLAIVAYNQPVTRAVIDTYRGVRSERVLNQLEDLHLIREVGRAELPGRPILYGTTKEFLQYFALTSLEDLPKLFPESAAKREESAAETETIPAPPSGAEYAALDKPSEGLQALMARMRRKQDREARRAETPGQSTEPGGSE